MLIILMTQMLFTFSTLWAKYNLSEYDSFQNSLAGSWLIIYVFVYIVATFMQLYVFKVTNILKAMAFFSGLALILTVILGNTILNEISDWRDIASVTLVLSALCIINQDSNKKHKS